MSNEYYLSPASIILNTAGIAPIHLPTTFEQQVHELQAKVSELEAELKKAQALIEELGYNPEYF